MRSKLYTLNKPMTDRTEYMKKIDEMAAARAKKRWCLNHPRSNWSEGFPQCTEGFQKGERCIEGVNEEENHEPIVEEALKKENPNVDTSDDDIPF